MLSVIRSSLLHHASRTTATNRGLSSAPMSLLGLLLCSPAFADDWYTGATQVVPKDQWIVAIDASTTYASNKSEFAYAVGTFAIGASTLQQSGARFRLEGLGGAYSYEQSATGQQVRGEQFEGGALVGYQQIWNTGALAGYVGFNVRENTLSVVDPSNPTAGTKAGLKTAIEAYLLPTYQTMLSGYASYSTAHNAYYVRGRAGYAAYDNASYGKAYVGPELTFLGDDFFGQWRVGVHLSGIRLGAVQLGVAGGYVWDRVNKEGYYATLDVRTGF